MSEEKRKETTRGGISVNERRAARIDAMKLLFEAEAQKIENGDDFFRDEMENLELVNDIRYVKTVFDGVLEHRGEIDSLIEENSNGWKINRISKVNLAVMRICVYEMKYYETDADEVIDFTVSINEAIEICKTYGDEKDPSFINGVLNAVAEKIGKK